MSWKSLVVLLVLVAGLGGFWYYDTYRLGPAREKKETAKGRLWDVEPKDVEAVILKRKIDTVKLKRVEGGWELVEPVQARADRATVDGVVTGLATARMDREIDPNPAKLDEFGLAPAEAEVSLQVKGRAEPLSLLIGSKSPTGVWVYGKEAAKPAVFLVSEIVARDVAKPTADLRDRTVLAFARKDVTGMDLDVAGDRMSVEAEDGGKWRLVKPRALPGDADLIGDFLEKLATARVQDFVVDRPASLPEWGLDKPASLTLWLGRDKERSSRTLHFGRVDPQKKGVFMMRAGEPGVMLVGEELWTVLPKTVGALRDKVVIAYAYDKVQRLEVEHARGRATIAREGKDWTITAPETLKADAGAVNGLLWRIRDLRAAGFLAEEPGAVQRYLAKPDVTVRIWEEGAKDPKTLLLAASRETRGGQPAALAAVAGQAPVMLVEAKALEDLQKTPDDLRDKTLMPAFELTDVKRLRLVAGGKPLGLERKGETDWRVTEPSRGTAKEMRVTDVLLGLKALRWKSIAAPGGDDASRFGLDKPGLEITLSKADGKEIAGLLVGRDDGPVTYVRLKSSPAIYAVDSKAIADFRKAPSDIPG
jgi:hypothetical protein